MKRIPSGKEFKQQFEDRDRELHELRPMHKQQLINQSLAFIAQYKQTKKRDELVSDENIVTK